ncbi:MAG: hypothetical protein QM571_05895 [Micrococcaceae bacterium]
MKANIIYRMALRSDAPAIAELSKGLPKKYSEVVFGGRAFGVVAIIEESDNYEVIGATWVIMADEDCHAFIRVNDEYDSEDIQSQLQEKLYEKAEDRNISHSDIKF